MVETAKLSLLAKACAVLQAFDPQATELGVNELARRTGIPKSTVHRVAGELARVGILTRVDRKYELGTMLFELGQLVPQRRDLREAALPFLEDLYVATRETVHLAVVADTDVVYVERIAGHATRRTPSFVSGHLPLHCTATGKALLAHSDPQLLASVLSAGLARRTPFTITLPSVLEQELAGVRSRGYAVEREETRVGFVSVASPVFARGDVAIAAISVTGPVDRLDLDRVAGGVRAAARGLTLCLRAGSQGSRAM